MLWCLCVCGGGGRARGLLQSLSQTLKAMQGHLKVLISFGNSSKPGAHSKLSCLIISQSLAFLIHHTVILIEQNCLIVCFICARNHPLETLEVSLHHCLGIVMSFYSQPLLMMACYSMVCNWFPFFLSFSFPIFVFTLKSFVLLRFPFSMYL